MLIAVGCSNVATDDGNPQASGVAETGEQLVGTSAVKWVDTITDLKTVTGQGVSATTTSTVTVLGRNARGDGGGGEFTWIKATPPAADDGGTIFLPNSQPASPNGPGYWKRRYSGPVDVRWFGANAEDAVDDTTAVQNAINSLGTNGGTVLFPAGASATSVFTFANMLNLDQKRGLRLIGASTNMYENGTPLRYTGSGTHFIQARSVDGLELRNLHFQYSNPAFTGSLVDFDAVPGVGDSVYNVIEGCAFDSIPPAVNAHALLRLNQTIITTVRNTHFMFSDYGIVGRDPSYSISIQIHESAFNGQNISAIHNADEDWLIEGCTFEPRADGTAGAYTHDLSLNGFWAHGMSWVSNWFGDANGTGTWIKVRTLAFNFTGNRMATSGGVGIQFYGGTQGANIAGNRIEGSNVTPLLFDPYSPEYGYHYGVSITGNDFCTGLPIADNGSIVEASILGNSRACGAGGPPQISNGLSVYGYLQTTPDNWAGITFGTLQATLPTGTAKSIVGNANGTADRVDQSLVLQSRSDIPSGEIFLMTGSPPTERIRVNQSGLTIGHGTPIAKHLSATAAWNPVSIASGAATGTTVPVPGAAVGDTVAVGFTLPVPQGAILGGAVTAADTVTVTLINVTGAPLDLAAGNVRADVWQH